jgi:hypothetical protein
MLAAQVVPWETGNVEANLIQPEQIEHALLLIRKEQQSLFQLSDEEAAGLIFQSGRSKQRGGRRRSLPYAFTEEGVVMLSSVRRGRCAMARRLRSVSQASTFNPQLLGGSDWAQLRLTHSQPSTLNHQLASAPPATPRREIGYHGKEATLPYRVKRK